MHPVVLILIFAILSGYFVDYLSIVLPEKRQFCHPICPTCKNNLSFSSFLCFKPCPFCGKDHYPKQIIIILLYVAVYIYSWLYKPHYLLYSEFLILMIYFGVVFFIDLKHKLILKETSLIGIILSLFLGFRHHSLLDTLAGGIEGFIMMGSIYLLGCGFIKLISYLKKQTIEVTAIGFGDVLFCLILGFLFGSPRIIGVFIFSILLSGIYSILYFLIGKLFNHYKEFSGFPYAPFLIFAAIVFLSF